jgi:hypothetical protein
MKVRNGFVSNSSSSSFIVFLPDFFDPKKHVDISNIKSKWAISEWCERFDVDDFTNDDAVKLVEKFIKNKSFWGDEEYAEMNMIESLLSDYVISSVEGGPGDGSCELIGSEKINAIFEKHKVEIRAQKLDNLKED